MVLELGGLLPKFVLCPRGRRQGRWAGARRRWRRAGTGAGALGARHDTGAQGAQWCAGARRWATWGAGGHGVLGRAGRLARGARTAGARGGRSAGTRARADSLSVVGARQGRSRCAGMRQGRSRRAAGAQQARRGAAGAQARGKGERPGVLLGQRAMHSVHSACFWPGLTRYFSGVRFFDMVRKPDS